MNVLALAAATALSILLETPPVLSVAPECTVGADSAEIVVCARLSDQRIKPQSGPTERSNPRAETQLADGVKIGLVAESASVGGGAKTNRAMVRLKISF